ncbi:MAG: hypothetical protein AB7K09_22350 [Planctomycetota bacterium]
MTTTTRIRRHLWLLALLASALAWLPATTTPALADDDDPAAPAEWDGRESRKEAVAMMEEYLVAATTPARQAEIEQFLDSLGVLKLRDSRKYEKDVLDLLKKSASDKLDTANLAALSFKHEALTGRVYVSGNTSAGAQKQALIIALHGGGEGVGDGSQAMQIFKGAASIGGIVIAPTAPELRGTAWNHEDIERWVIALVEAAKNTWDIDTNRIYFIGHSMGGFGTWSIGCKHADRLAAISPNAGGIFANPGNTETGGLASGHIPNLLNTPVWFYHSTDDPRVGVQNDQLANAYLTKLKGQGYPFEWVYKEYTDRGHGFPADGHGPIYKWLGEHTRNPYPLHILWEPSREQKKLFFWIEATNTAAQYGATGRIEGKIDKASNTVTITSSGNPGDITVYLNEKLVDLTKPVTITQNGEVKFQGHVYPQLSVLLHSVARTRDPLQYYNCRVSLSGRTSLGPAPAPGPGPGPGSDPKPDGDPAAKPPTDEPVAPPPPAVEKYEKGTDEFKRFMDIVAQVVPRGHRVNRDATSVTNAISMLNEQYKDKLVRMLDHSARGASGDDRKLLREFSEMAAGG